jgi:homoserine acetyltransferase
LIPSHELENFAELLRSGRDDSASVVYNEMSSLYGHDAFFKELSWLVRNSVLF